MLLPRLIFFIVYCFICFSQSYLWADSVSNVRNNLTPHSQSLPRPAQKKTDFQKPLKPELSIPKNPTKKVITLADDDTFILHRVIFNSHTLFTNEQLQAIAAPFIGKAVSLNDLEELRFRLSQHYHKAGYTTSGAVFPDQTINHGVVHFKLIEGKLAAINIKGQEGLHSSYISDRLFLNSHEHFNSLQLQENFQKLLSDPLISRLNGNIRPSTKIGEAVLDLKVTRARPYDFYLMVDNHHTTSGGEIRGVFNGMVRNLTGYGDSLNVSFQNAKGALKGDINFSLPLNAKNTQLHLGITSSDFEVIEDNLQLAEIENDYSSFNIGFSHPVYLHNGIELSLSLSLSKKQSQTFLLGEGTPFTEGIEENGKASTSVVHFSQDLSLRGQDKLLALRSTLNIGLHILNATDNHHKQADGQFISWVGQGQYIQRLDDKGQQIHLRGNLQLANTHLLSLEQIAIGGPDSVRGYRSNYLIRDNGLDVSMEYRMPLLGNAQENKQANLSISAFIDAGLAWNAHQFENKKNIASAGLGLIWQSAQWSSQLYWAHRFNSVPEYSNHYLQDEGLTFRLMMFF